jgi:hemolysin activation/secretion protein
MTNKNLLPLISFLLCNVVWAADLPPAATPGGAIPKEEFRYPKPFVYPKASPPPVVEEKIEQTESGAPRMHVRGFRIQGVDENVEVGITQQLIEQLVKVTAERMVKTVAADGFTISMFETITGAVSHYYRERGYFLTRAYIPEQTVKDGIVTINIVEGFIDQMVFRGNELYSDEQLSEALQPLKGKSVYKPDIENILFTLNDFPGLSSSMVFGPGLEPGSAAIQLNATEVPSSTSFMFDNFGSVYTGENRWRINHRRNNTFGQADSLDLNLIVTTSPANSTYFDAAYEQPVIDYRFAAGGGFATNSFDVAGNLSDLGINGESQDMYGYMRYLFKRDRSQRLSAEAGMHLKSAVSKVRSTANSEDKLTVIYLSGDYAGTSWSSSGVFQTAKITLSFGLEGFLGSMDGTGNIKSGRKGGSGEFANGGFSKIEYAYTRQYALAPLQSLVFSFRGQNSSDLLTSMEQFSLGGPDTVRAYPVAESLMDSAYIFSVEWFAFASPDVAHTWTNNMQLSVFYDYAKGSLNDPLRNDIESVSYSGLGGSVQINPLKDLTMKATLAFDLGDKPSDNMSWPFYFNLKYDF